MLSCVASTRKDRLYIHSIYFSRGHTTYLPIRFFLFFGVTTTDAERYCVCSSLYPRYPRISAPPLPRADAPTVTRKDTPSQSPAPIPPHPLTAWSPTSSSSKITRTCPGDVNSARPAMSAVVARSDATLCYVPKAPAPSVKSQAWSVGKWSFSALTPNNT